MTLSINEFINEVATSGVISAADLLTWLSGIAEAERPQSGEELARELVQQQKLTKFQAEQIYSGQGKSLTLGNYLVLDKLGQGGMGLVLKALHRRMERIVALKVMSQAGMRSPDAVQRFHREVKAAAKLSHPNIVTAFDADEANGTHFLVMEYVEGTDLSAFVRKYGPLPVEQAVQSILQVARGLEYAHSRGVIHRDIKPSNLLLTQAHAACAVETGDDIDQTVESSVSFSPLSLMLIKILDMGLARIDGGQIAGAELTTTGAVMGTVDYMAPEQALSAKSADARSDIYSLGISLWYLLTGRVAYEGDSMMSKLLAHRDAAIPSLSERLSFESRPPSARLSVASLDAVFRRMVAKRPEDRQQSMTEVIRDLECCLSGLPATSTTSMTLGSAISPATAEAETMMLSGVEPEADLRIGASPTGATERDQQPRKSRTQLFGLIAAVVIGLIVLVVASSGRSKTETASLEIQAPHVQNIQQVEPEAATINAISAPASAVAPFDAKQARAHQEAWAMYLDTTVETTNSAGGKMVLIPPGEFLMGSSDEQLGAIIKEVEQLTLGRETIDRILKQERPQHRVILARSFFLGATEVTIGQFKKFVEATGFKTYAEANVTDAQSRTYLKPGYPVTDDCPVSCVSWEEAAAYCRWLSGIEKTNYRLPTEAEWEYACRAGTRTLWSWGDDPKLAEKFAWTQSTSEGRTHPVASKQPNAFGVFDMHGNLSEWCQDSLDETWYARSPVSDPIAHIGLSINVRGGAFTHFAITRSAYRSGYGPGDFHPLRGFRVMREIDSPQEQPSADRRAAEWVIAQGGSVMVFGQEKWIVGTDDLPLSGLRLMHVKLGRPLAGADADLVPLRQLNNLVSVGMDSSNVSAAGITGLESLPALEQVGLGGVRLSDEQFTALARLKGLKQLGLHGVDLTSEQCATLARALPQLVYLNLSSNRQIDDTALNSLRQLAHLTLLELNGTQVTAAGVAALQKALPNCKIQWGGETK